MNPFLGLFKLLRLFATSRFSEEEKRRIELEVLQDVVEENKRYREETRGAIIPIEKEIQKVFRWTCSCGNEIIGSQRCDQCFNRWHLDVQLEFDELVLKVAESTGNPKAIEQAKVPLKWSKARKQMRLSRDSIQTNKESQN